MLLNRNNLSKITLLLIGVILLVAGQQIFFRPQSLTIPSVKAESESTELAESKDALPPNERLANASQALAEFAQNDGQVSMDKVGRNIFATSGPTYLSPREVKVELNSIELTSLTPNHSYPSQQPLEVLIGGRGLRAGLTVNVDGIGVRSRLINGQDLMVEIPKERLSSPGNITIEVKDSAGHTRNMVFTVQSRPRPPFLFAGYTADANGTNRKAILLQGTERLMVVEGMVFQNHWRVIDFSSEYIDLEDITLSQQHRLMVGEDPKVSQAAKEPQVKESRSREPQIKEAVQNDEELVVAPVTQNKETNKSLFSRSETPMTYAELLKKRAEKHGKRK